MSVSEKWAVKSPTRIWRLPSGERARSFLFNICTDWLEDDGVRLDIICDSSGEDVGLFDFFDEEDRRHLIREETPSIVTESDTSGSVNFFDCLSSTPAVTRKPIEDECLSSSSEYDSCHSFTLSEEESVRFEFLPETVNKKQPKCIVYSTDSNNYPKSEVAAPYFKDKKNGLTL